MWLRPRTEMLMLTTRWWEFDALRESLIAMLLGALNLAYVAAAALGIVLAWKKRVVVAPGWGLLLIFIVLRSLFLATLENPEPRYTLECFPVVFVMAAAALLCLAGSEKHDARDRAVRPKADLPRSASISPNIR